MPFRQHCIHKKYISATTSTYTYTQLQAGTKKSSNYKNGGMKYYLSIEESELLLLLHKLSSTDEWAQY